VSWQPWVPEAVIFALAGVLRLGWPGLTEFKLDESVLTRAGLSLAHGQGLPLAGPTTSLGPANGPFSIYLLAIPFLVSSSVIFATLFVGALNLAAVAGAYALTRRWLGRRAALMAALLYATSPWAIFLTRKLWPPALVSPFIVLYAASALAFTSGSRRAIIVHLLSLAILLQTYLALLALIPATLVLLVCSWRRLSWRTLAVAVVLSGLVFVPYLLYQAQKGWSDVQVGLGLAHQPVQVDATAWQLGWIAVVGSNVHSLAGADAFLDYLATVPNVEPLLAAEGLLVIAGSLWLAWHLLRPPPNAAGQGRAAGLFVLTWALAPILILTRHSVPIYLHYFILILPAPYLLAAYAADGLWRRAGARLWPGLVGRLAHLVVFALLTSIALSQTILIVAMLRFVADHSTGAFGIPLAYRLEAAQRLRELASIRGADEAIIVGEGDNPAWHETPGIFDVLLWDGPPHRFADGLAEGQLLLPGGPTLILMAPGEWPVEHPLAAWADLSLLDEIPLRPGEGRYRLFFATSRASAVHAITPPARLGNGAELLGYDLIGELQPGQKVQLDLLWRITAPGNSDYHFFNHLVDTHGERWAQKDGPSLPSWAWRPGGRILNTFTLNLDPNIPPGRYWVRTGMYRYPEVENVPVLDEAGNPIGDAITLGPFDVAGAGQDDHP